MLPIPYASSTGINGLSIQNAGQVQNKGIEISATWRSSIGDKANYYIGANLSTANNKVTEINAGGKYMSMYATKTGTATEKSTRMTSTT